MEHKIEITIKESMILRKCINDYVIDNKLDYDKSPLFNGLIHKLKDVENGKVETKYIQEAIKNEAKINPNGKNLFKALSQARINYKNDNRKSLNKELKKYSIQTTCNKKILELMENERIELVNKTKRNK